MPSMSEDIHVRQLGFKKGTDARNFDKNVAVSNYQEVCLQPSLSSLSVLIIETPEV